MTKNQNGANPPTQTRVCDVQTNEPTSQFFFIALSMCSHYAAVAPSNTSFALILFFIYFFYALNFLCLANILGT